MTEISEVMPATAALREPASPPPASLDDLVRYYSEAGPDYSTWSPTFNMHFGYFRAGMDPFAREPQLDRMNDEVLDRLELDRDRPVQLLDAGCGVGATVRHAARRFPFARVTGISIVPWQVDRAREMTRAADERRVRFECRDYMHAGFATGTFDGIYAIESVCHAPGHDKQRFLREAYRLLRPGGRLVIADAFLNGQTPGRFTAPLIDRVCRCWVIEQWARIDAFAARLERCGFDHIHVENLRWRVAPVALHVPIVTLRFFFREWIVKRARLSPERFRNAIAPILALLLALPGGPLGYYLVSARRARSAA